MSLQEIPEWAVTLLLSVIGWGVNKVRKLFQESEKKRKKICDDLDIAFNKIRALEQREKENGSSRKGSSLVACEVCKREIVQ